MRQLILACVVAGAAPAVYGDIWQWTHQASGMGSANVFDGGPVVFRDDETNGPNDDRMNFAAIDRTTQPGVLSAEAYGDGDSHIIESSDERLRTNVNLGAGYHPSGFPGGDNPGGEAEALLQSVIEFRLPFQQLEWFYRLDIDNDDAPIFGGTASVVVQNISHSQLLLDVSDNTGSVFTTLSGQSGDLIRITTMMAGSGSMPPASGRNFRADLQMRFTVPEPATLLFLCTGVVGALRRRNKWRIART